MLCVRTHLFGLEANSVHENIILLIKNTTHTGIRKDEKVFLTLFYPLWTGKDKVLLSNKTGFSSRFN